jgi:AraC-like DNA-binding protein
MKETPGITNVGFVPSGGRRLTVEAMTIDDLKKRAPADHFEKMQRADFYRLVGVVEGQSYPMVDFSKFEVQAGDWLLVRPGQVFRYDFSKHWAGWIVVFRPDVLSGLGRSGDTAIDIQRRVEDLVSLRSLNDHQHDWMKRALQQMQLDVAQTTDDALRNELLRLQVIGTLLRLSMWQMQDSVAGIYGAAENGGFRRFRHALDADFATKHHVKHYASALGMSEKTLSRVCVAATGLPAKALINQRVVLEARRLLAHTSMAVQAIGHGLGFDEPTNFVKFFRKEAGMTPLAFRQDVVGVPLAARQGTAASI